MRNSGERLRQLLNINNPDNTIVYDEEQFERRSSLERNITSPSSSMVTVRPLSTSGAAISDHSQPINAISEMVPPGTPTSTSTLQAGGGHRLPRPHMSLLKQQHRDSTSSMGFTPRVDYDGGNFDANETNGHHLLRHNYYQGGK